MSQRAVDSVKSRPEDDPLAGLPEDAAARVRRFIAAARLAKVQEADFRACVLMSLVIFVDDELLDKALCDALETVGLGRVQ